jgi:hypothetical protein
MIITSSWKRWHSIETQSSSTGKGKAWSQKDDPQLTGASDYKMYNQRLLSCHTAICQNIEWPPEARGWMAWEVGTKGHKISVRQEEGSYAHYCITDAAQPRGIS